MEDENFLDKKAAAIKYNKEIDDAPKLKAKGSGYVAENIIKVAKDNDIPIIEDHDLIELLSKVEVDKQIPGNMYKAVAEVFAFLYDSTKKAKDK